MSSAGIEPATFRFVATDLTIFQIQGQELDQYYQTRLCVDLVEKHRVMAVTHMGKTYKSKIKTSDSRP